MKTAVFGGTFDPIHVVHLVIAEQVREILNIDQVLFVPAGRPPHKKSAETESMHRLEMVRLATADNPNFAVTDLELEGNGPSYTVETLRQMRERGLGGIEDVYLLIGGDSLREFDTWKDWQEILDICTLVVVPRPGVRIEGPIEAMKRAEILYEMPLLDISSTVIRQRLQEGKSIRYLVTDPVWHYIDQHALYRERIERS